MAPRDSSYTPFVPSEDFLEQPFVPSVRPSVFLLPGLPVLECSDGRDSSRTLWGSNPAVIAISSELEAMQSKKDQLVIRSSDLDLLYKTRMEPIQEELAELCASMLDKQVQLEMLINPPDSADPPPGPAALLFIDGVVSQFVCSVVVLANMVVMVFEMQSPESASRFWRYDQLFLTFYCLELITKSLLHRRGLLVGKVAVVWWNWMDMLIVLSGVLDQWMVPMLKETGVFHSDGVVGVKLNFLRMLRVLRLFRIMRVLKIVKVFLRADLSWTEGAAFQSFIIGIVMLNSVLMALELDSPWVGWYWCEQAMLVVYSFELAVRLKRWGWKFFVHPNDWKMNILDFIIVAGGVVEQWLVPTVYLIEAVVTGEPPRHHGATFGNVILLLRMMRLLRVLRLIRLMRHIKPLYRLLSGLLAALEGIQWVLLLACIMLYAAAILFTNVVGHGVIDTNENGQHPMAEQIFGTVGQSLFSLFKMMSGDQSVIEPVLSSLWVRLLFVAFVIMSNWIMLAILTAVVSDNMIGATTESQKEDEEKRARENREVSCRRLVGLFEGADKEKTGSIEEAEFFRMIRDPDVLNDMQASTGLKLSALQDLWLFLSTDGRQGRRSCRYDAFSEQVLDESRVVTERSVYRLEKRVEIMEYGLRRELQSLRSELFSQNRIDSSSSPAAFAAADATAKKVHTAGVPEENSSTSCDVDLAVAGNGVRENHDEQHPFENRSFFHKLHRATYRDLDHMVGSQASSLPGE